MVGSSRFGFGKWAVSTALLGAMTLPGLGLGLSPALAQGFGNPAGAPSVPFQRYIVYVEGGGFSLLSRIQAIEPSAFETVFQGRSVIQAGSFTQWENVQQRIRTLANSGLSAQAVALSGPGGLADVPSFAPPGGITAQGNFNQGDFNQGSFNQGNALPNFSQIPTFPQETGQFSPAPNSLNNSLNVLQPGQVYAVIVNGNSPLLLDQIRLVEPSAFVVAVQGRSAIQAGTFNRWDAAQARVQQLGQLGVGAAVLTIQGPASGAFPVVGGGSFGPAGVPVSVQPAWQSAAPQIPQAQFPQTQFPQAQAQFPQIQPTQVPFGQPSQPFFVPQDPPPATINPLPTNALAPGSLPDEPGGFYVALPTSGDRLTALANQVVALGAPANLVRPRTAPRGPHVLVGPFLNQDLAREWQGYFQRTGLDARLHHQ